MKLGPQGAALIKSFEQCRLSAYLPTADDVPTIGFGHTRGVSMGDTCTAEEADTWFLDDIAWVEECVNKAVVAFLSQTEFDALCSLCFNIGCSAFGKSTLVKLLNQADFDGAGKEFLKWDKQHGKVLSGLSARRLAEQELFDSSPTA